MPNGKILLNVQLLEPYWGNVLAIKGPCFGYFYNIFASRCLTWLKFSLKSQTCQNGYFGIVWIYFVTWEQLETPGLVV